MSAGEVERALGNLEGLVRKGVAPSHYVARHVLLALGEELRAEAPGSCGALLERVRAAGRAAGPAWAQAVQTELTLACGEFAQSVDPRYLNLPDYDTAYTRSARVRLGDRLRAAQELGFELSSREAQVLELADRVLATHTAKRGENDLESPAAHPPRAPGSRGVDTDNNARK